MALFLVCIFSIYVESTCAHFEFFLSFFAWVVCVNFFTFSLHAHTSRKKEYAFHRRFSRAKDCVDIRRMEQSRMCVKTKYKIPCQRCAQRAEKMEVNTCECAFIAFCKFEVDARFERARDFGLLLFCSRSFCWFFFNHLVTKRKTRLLHYHYGQAR